jgi:hypothetical protein
VLQKVEQWLLERLPALKAILLAKSSRELGQED